MIAASGEEKKMFRVTPFQYVVFDEAHMLKNMLTQRYAALIRIGAERRILLTGTPLQNNLLELMSLLCFVMPSIFASKTEDIKSLFQQKVVSCEPFFIISRFIQPFSTLRKIKSTVLLMMQQQ
jgi:SWI/SNF-related matrix-associated actin-dependent regulator of chromatin subfamily A containing DEAD/H box 1